MKTRIYAAQAVKGLIHITWIILPPEWHLQLFTAVQQEVRTVKFWRDWQMLVQRRLKLLRPQQRIMTSVQHSTNAW